MTMRRILLVEDDETQAAATMRELRKENISSAHSSNISDAVYRLAGEEFDCLILDIGIPDGPSPEEIIEMIPNLGVPVVVYTGIPDHEIAKAVRQTGAAYVEKPGIDLLVEKVWSQINYKRGDAESAIRQQLAQRQLRKPNARWQNAGVIIALLALSGGFCNWAWQAFSLRVEQGAEIKHKFELINTRADRLDDMARKMDAAIEQIRSQNQISIDERRALKENQIELKTDITSRLDRIENKLDRKAGAITAPLIIPKVAKE